MENLASMTPLLIAAVSGIMSLLAIVLSYIFGRQKNSAEIKKLEGEKKNVEAAAGLSTAEAASIISRAAADVVQPLTNRIRELQLEAKAMSDRHVQEMSSVREKYFDLENHMAAITKENIDLKTKVAHLEATVALLSKPRELANETSKRLGEA